MKVLRMLGGTAAVVAMLGMALPADAQSNRGRYRGHHGHHRGGGIDGGDVLLGAILAGGIIAVASAANRKREQPVETYEPAPPYDGSYEPAPYNGGGYDAAPSPAGEPGGYGDAATDEAVDACAAAAEQQGQGFARIARVTSIDAVDPVGASWAVRGMLELRDDYRAAATPHAFRCMLTGQDAPSVRIDGIDR